MAESATSNGGGDDVHTSAATSAIEPSEGCIIHMENIPPQIDEYSLNQVMRHFGKVWQCSIILGEDPDGPAEAFLAFKKPSEAQSALKADGKLVCGGCPLRITLWKGSFPSDVDSKPKTAKVATGREKCWFCVSNAECENHMIAFVSKHSYIAIAKGALTPNHSLVAPIYHYPSAASADIDVLEDMQRLVDCLMDVCIKAGMGAIAFERYMPMQNPQAMHTQIQVIPVPLKRAMEAFSYVNQSEHFSGSRVERLDPEKQTSLTSLKGRLDSINRSYFYLQAIGRDTKGKGGLVHSHCLWSLGHKGCGRRIPITFGRELVIHLLPDNAVNEMPNVAYGYSKADADWRSVSLDWRNCVTSQEHEAELTKRVMNDIADCSK